MLWDIAFDQPDLARRLELARMTLGGVVFALACSPSYGTFYTRGEALLRGRSGAPALGILFVWLRASVACLAVLVALGLGGVASVAGLLVAFGILDGRVARCTPGLWNNVSHVHVFLLALCVAGVAPLVATGPTATAVASFALTAMQVQIALVYLFAGVSKLRVGGVAWFADGRTLLAAAIFRGTPIGRRAVAVPALRRGMGVATAAFELGAPALVLWPAAHPSLAFLALGFHLGVMLTLRISFWHLWAFFPALLLAR